MECCHGCFLTSEPVKYDGSLLGALQWLPFLFRINTRLLPWLEMFWCCPPFAPRFPRISPTSPPWCRCGRCGRTGLSAGCGRPGGGLCRRFRCICAEPARCSSLRPLLTWCPFPEILPYLHDQPEQFLHWACFISFITLTITHMFMCFIHFISCLLH